MPTMQCTHSRGIETMKGGPWAACRQHQTFNTHTCARLNALPALATVKVAPDAIHTGLRSLMGEPVTMLPPKADTLRIWLPANHLMVMKEHVWK
eukprot:1158030-Pelagomonas_calceolata.AAC.1